MNSKKSNKVRYDITIPVDLKKKADALKPYFSAFIARCLSNDKLLTEFKNDLSRIAS